MKTIKLITLILLSALVLTSFTGCTSTLQKVMFGHDVTVTVRNKNGVKI